MKIILIALGAIAAGSVAANAQVQDMPMSATVSYSDLNLSDAGARKVLERRVKKGIRRLCLEATGPIPPFYVEVSCRRFAWNGARPQIALAISRARSQSAMQDGSAIITVLARR